MPQLIFRIRFFCLLFTLAGLGLGAAARAESASLAETVAETVQPLMQTHGIPGLAVGIIHGKERHFLSYGVASKTTQQPVTPDTLFELGSISKTFVATLATYAQHQGKLSLDAPVSAFLPVLRGSAFDQVTPLHLATHTAGDLPLQVPDAVQDLPQLFDYLHHRQAALAPGTQRHYSNISIGLLGLLTAQRLNVNAQDALEKTLFPALGLHNSYLHVPSAKQALYAQGYNASDQPVRLNPGVLADEAYGVKSSVADLVQFVAAQLQQTAPPAPWPQALADTRRAYFQVGPMQQALIWEQYPYPVTLDTLLEGNGPAMIFHSQPVKPLQPPLPPQREVWVNKTGSTNGFGAYVAFVPERQLGIVLLANKNYPIAARVTAAHQVLRHLERARVSGQKGE